MTGQVTEWVPVETTEGPARMRADNGSLLIHGLLWSYLTPAMWEAMKATGDRLLAGERGREAEAAGMPEPRYCHVCRMAGNDDSKLGRDVVRNVEGAPPEGLLADVCENGHVFEIKDEEE